MIWVLEYVDEDSYNVVRRGRQLRKQVTLDMAKRYLRRHRQPAEKMMIEEKDGYRVPLSNLR